MISSYNRCKNDTYGIVPVCDLVKDIGTYGENHHASSNGGETVINSNNSLSIDGLYDNCKKIELNLYETYERKAFNKKLKKSLRYFIKRFFQKYFKFG